MGYEAGRRDQKRPVKGIWSKRKENERWDQRRDIVFLDFQGFIAPSLCKNPLI